MSFWFELSVFVIGNPLESNIRIKSKLAERPEQSTGLVRQADVCTTGSGPFQARLEWLRSAGLGNPPGSLFFKSRLRIGEPPVSGPSNARV